MQIKKILKSLPGLYTIIFNFLRAINYFNKRFHYSYKKYSPNAVWTKRTQIVKQSSDNLQIPRVNSAGKILKDYQVMHNGLKINLGSYYDYGNTFLLSENKGVHEPQEEYAFQEVLKKMPQKATMVEMGAYWAFYSMWFASQINNYSCIMIEPDIHKLLLGKWNFKKNNFKGQFIHAYIDEVVTKNITIPAYSVDYLLEKLALHSIDILHSDIQGYELKMLNGATQALRENLIGYLFVSTHSNKLHQECLSTIKRYDYKILCEADLESSYAMDGLIVAKSNDYPGIESLDISKRKSNHDLN